MEEKSTLFQPRALRLLLGTVALYALLVATHLGEFWPFTIYPMFSQAGQPWTRTVVREVNQFPNAQLWKPVEQNALPGQPVVLPDFNIAPEDIANFVSKTNVWDDQRVKGLQNVFTTSGLGNPALMVYRADGRLTRDDEVDLQFIPVIWLTPDSTVLHPDLRP